MDKDKMPALLKNSITGEKEPQANPMGQEFALLSLKISKLRCITVDAKET